MSYLARLDIRSFSTVNRYGQYFPLHSGRLTNTYLYTETSADKVSAYTTAKTYHYLKGFPFFSIRSSSVRMEHYTHVDIDELKELFESLRDAPEESRLELLLELLKEDSSNIPFESDYSKMILKKLVDSYCNVDFKDEKAVVNLLKRLSKKTDNKNRIDLLQRIQKIHLATMQKIKKKQLTS
ncbi:MAG: hypothetical protein ACD_7C00353G0001 [uncultured bacterium]|nr:MAG: hypothetical protein ACD_7C00353G0001 [uncultured bacterium]